MEKQNDVEYIVIIQNHSKVCKEYNDAISHIRDVIMLDTIGIIDIPIENKAVIINHIHLN